MNKAKKLNKRLFNKLKNTSIYYLYICLRLRYMSKKNINIKELAKKIGVATSTVSRALQDHPSISQKTKKIVAKAVKDYNYKPNSVAASLRKGKGNYIGLIIPKINSNFMSNCVFGIESITYPSGYNLIICQSNENYEKEVRNIQTLINSNVAGIILSLSNETKNTDHLKIIGHNNIPLVLFDRIDKSLNTNCIVNDNYEGSVKAVAHLVAMGYKKISAFCGPQTLEVYKSRFNGYSDTLDKSSLEKREAWINTGIQTKDEAYTLTKKMFNNNDKPDAIFCTNDRVALGAILALKEMGIKIPEDVGIVGYSNDIFSETSSPTITSVEQFPQDIGVNSAQIMLDILDGKIRQDTHKTISINSKLIIRESSSR